VSTSRKRSATGADGEATMKYWMINYEQFAIELRNALIVDLIECITDTVW
jgi:hypothetical protein